MNVPALSGARVTLRRPVDEDADAWLNLPRDPEIVRMFGGDPALIRPKTRAQAEHWLRGLRERVTAGIAVADERRRLDRERLASRLRGEDDGSAA